MTFKPADIGAALAELKRDGTTVDLVAGETYRLPSGLQQVGEGSTLDGHGAMLVAPSPMRIVTRKPGAVLKNFSGSGYITLYNYASRYIVEDVTLDHSLDGITYLDHGAKAAATGMFMTWLPLATTRRLEGLTYRRCTGYRSYHHTFNLNLEGGDEGGEFRDVLYEGCKAFSPGSGFEGDGARDWSCGFDIPDAGDITRMTVRDCLVDDPWQDGFHLDGSWEGHRQTITDVLFERCTATRAGRRCSAQSVEKFLSGFYTPSGRLVDCHTESCLHAGFAFKNEVPNSLVVERCSDLGSVYGMIAEYGCNGARIEFASTAAVYRAFQGQVTGSGAKLDLTITKAPKVACTFGRTARVDFLDCPNHEADVNGKYARLGYTIPDGAVTIQTNEDLGIEVWPASKMNLKTITWLPLEDEPPTPVDDTTVPPPPLADLGRIVYGPYGSVRLTVPALGRDVPVGLCPPDLEPYFRDGTYTPEA